jgi:sec-independent protein translocase protein TatB
MFDIGFWEIFLLLVLALVVIGPERLPGAARTAGYWIGRARRFVEGVKTDVEEQFDVTEFKRLMHNQEVQINELQRKLNDTTDLSGEHHTDHRYEIHDDIPHADDMENIMQGEESVSVDKDGDTPPDKQA